MPDYPWFTGLEAEKGSGKGLGANVPLALYTTEEDYLEALRSVLWRHVSLVAKLPFFLRWPLEWFLGGMRTSQAVVVSLRVDTAATGKDWR